ncbi:unnamed protein product [Prunus armeniaca]
MDIHAGLKSASPPGSLRANIPWSLGCFVLGTCSFPATLHIPSERIKLGRNHPPSAAGKEPKSNLTPSFHLRSKGARSSLLEGFSPVRVSSPNPQFSSPSWCVQDHPLGDSARCIRLRHK